MAGRSTRRSALLVATSIVTLLAGACTPRTTIPAGAQQIRLVGTPTEVRLTPSTVRAGDVYVVIEGTGALLVEKSDAPQATRPFTDDELADFIRTGDTFHTSIQDVTAGYAGNVWKLTFGPGTYAFLPIASGEARPDVDLGAREELCHRDAAACAALPPLPVAVLEVLP